MRLSLISVVKEDRNMAEIKFTKNELRAQQSRLGQLEKYLPTLQLKKALLQLEVNEARHAIILLEHKYQEAHDAAEQYAALLTQKINIDPKDAVKVTSVKKRYENVAGVEVPYFEGITFEDFDYSLLETPAWFDDVVIGLRSLTTSHVEITVAEEKKAALENELRQVSIRVNLFEKILIPRAKANIKKIKVFLGDLQLSSVSQMKVAKAKIEERKKALLERKQ